MKGLSRLELVAEGIDARRSGMSRNACPFDHDGMRVFWLEGYDRAYDRLDKAFPSGGPLLGSPELGEDGPLLATA